MRRHAHLLAIVAPILLLLFFRLAPQFDRTVRIPLIHFYIVTFTAFAATVVSFLLVTALGSVARPRHILAAVAFAVMGSLFSVHGLTTPGAIIPLGHPATPAVSWASSLTLFVGGVIYLIASLDGVRGYKGRHTLPVIIGGAAAVMMFVSVVVVAPHVLGSIEENLAPWHFRTLFGASFIVWLVSAVNLFVIGRETGDNIDRVLATVGGLLTVATISMHLFTLWHLSWWLYHFLLLGSFLLVAYTLFSEYEQARVFRLSHYFLAAAAILTAMLGLTAAYLFSEFAEYLLAASGGTPGGIGQPGVGDLVVQARYTGLLIAILTMGLLFTALWLVVRRADGIIAARSNELAAAYQSLREAEMMRDDLTHMIVHDLRTPLTAIMTSVGLLKRLPDDAGAEMEERVVSRTVRAAERMEHMIDEILLVSKMERGELTPRRENVLVSQLLSQQLDPFFLQANSESKTLLLDCPDELEAILDRSLTGRVVENLVSNALKYTRRGGHVKVSAWAKNGMLTMSVSDDGEGVPDAFKETIFNKFGQVPELEGRPLRKGTGLGLAFCRLAIEAHGGKIWVQDAPGGGSDFTVVMPRS